MVAIPANDEADRIGACLAALATQRDRLGAPLPEGAFDVLVLANNCRDDTAAVARAWAGRSPHPTIVVGETLAAEQANAGWARKRAMDLAADRLTEAGALDGVILTTDADSCVAPTWVDATMAAFAEGVDAVAGYVDANPPELVALGPVFVARGRLEDRYLRAIAEIEARCDPRPHDPWPTHRVSSGASLAVTLAAYRAIGGLPPRPVGEDAALTRALEEGGFKVRHALDVCVATSCRVEGRAAGGAADTIRLRRDVAEAPCDADMQPVRSVLRAMALRGRLRRAFGDAERTRAVLRRLGSSGDVDGLLARMTRARSFALFWQRVAETCPLAAGPLRPAELPAEIARAETVLRRLRGAAAMDAAADRADRSLRSASCAALLR